MFDWFRDLKYALRRLSATPGFTAATLITLALGIGANTAIFSIIHTVLIEPLPFPEPNRLIGVWQSAPGVNLKELNASLADFITYREHSKTYADVALWDDSAMSVTEFPDPERIEGMAVSERLLPMLGISPMLGRQFTEADSSTKAQRVVMISYAYWQRRFAGDPNVIGRRFRASGNAHEIIGVLPRDFWFLDNRTDYVAPFRYDRAAVRLAGYNFQAIARLKPGVTMEQANADLARMIALEMDLFPTPPGFTKQMLLDARLAPNIHTLSDEFLGDISRSLWVIMATIGIVLLIACANVANLLLVRMEGRAQEFAVRAALGANRGQIARTMFAESIAIALLGGTLGIGFAWGVLKLVLSLAPGQLPRMDHIGISWASIGFTLVVSLLAGLALAVIPVLKHGGQRLAEALRAGGRNASSSRSRNYASSMLTVVQVGLALVLLVGSGLMVRTFQSVRNVHPGFAHNEPMQTLRITFPTVEGRKPEVVRQFFQNMQQRLQSVPGVTSVGLMDGIPMTNYSSTDPVFASDRTYAANQIPPLRSFYTAGPGVFATLGVPVLAGHEFQWNEVQQGRRQVIISENFAKEYWGSAQNAIGRQVRSDMSAPWSEIVGVVGDVRHKGSDQKSPTAVYFPIRDHGSLSLIVRSQRTGSEGLMNDIRQSVWAIDGTAPVTRVSTLKSIYDRSMARTSFTLTLLGISGGMALLLAVVGVYAVISYTVAQRRKEIGIRVALGANNSELTRMFLARGLLWSGIGASVGLVAAAVLSQLMSKLLFEISPLDPATYLGAAGSTLLAAAIASYLPARRVTQVDPIEALRAD